MELNRALWRVGIAWIVFGTNLHSIAYVTHGKMKQIKEKMITMPKENIGKLCIVMSD